MRVRKAKQDELVDVFLMGYDAWGANLPVEMYLDSCMASYKYRLGEFYVLEGEEGVLLSSCIVYPLTAFGGIVSERAVGLGSLASIANERRKGHATMLLSLLMHKLEGDGVDAFFVHSDIPPKIYENLGFVAAPEPLRQKSDGALPMLRLGGGRNVSGELWNQLVMPSYF